MYTGTDSEKIVDGFTLRVRRQGKSTAMDADRPQIVMIHGLHEGWNIWQPLLASLIPRYQVNLLEFPWSGSQGMRWGFHKKTEEWIRLGLDLASNNRTVFLAHSFGANALLEYLTAYGTDRVDGIVLFAPFYKVDHREFTWPLIEYYMKQHHKLLKTWIKLNSGGRDIPPEIFTSMYEKVLEMDGPIEWVQFMNVFFRTPDLPLSFLDVPCLVICGANDTASLAADCCHLAERLPAGNLVLLPECGHFPTLENPAMAIKVVKKFLGIL